MQPETSSQDVVLGKSIPSGKLTDTWAASYEDYPSSENFSHNNGDTNDEYYSDGDYVGYCYLTPSTSPNYCFGCGKGYTDFAGSKGRGGCPERSLPHP